MTPPLRRALQLTLILLLAACIYLPSMHLIFRRNITTYRTPQGLSPVATQLAATYLDVWNDPTQREQQLARMRKLNPEWDFMSRTYLVLAFANMALRDPAFQTDALTIIDAIIADTLQREQADGHAHFLLAYGNAGHWVADPPRSIFVDGEIALMIGARRLLQDDPDLKSQHTHRTHAMIRQMQQSPVLCAESYPDECWLFCNTVALAAIRISAAWWHSTSRSLRAPPSTALSRVSNTASTSTWCTPTTTTTRTRPTLSGSSIPAITDWRRTSGSTISTT